jgi:stearoyl-CoA desaturase (delta-9 desaturase)
LIAGPVVAVALLLLRARPAVSLLDVGMAVVMYVITGFGIAVGYHRLLTHSSFTARRSVRLVLVAAGSMAVEGSPIGWVANHRRHHVFSDKNGDPHSPWQYDGRPLGRVRGLLWSHLGWLFSRDTTSAARFAPDLLRDRDIAIMSRLFPVLAMASILLPGLVGWAVTGTFAGAATGVVWAGLVRIALLHHVTWSVNSLCHMFGARPFDAPDHSANIAPLALLSFGESWHNFHHACPSAARHGVLPHQIDAAAGLIRFLERSGLASKVRWPSSARIAVASRDSTDA